MKRWITIAFVALMTSALIPMAPAHANVDSWAHVWDREQTVSTSGNAIFVFPRHLQCPDNFHVAVSWVKWGYTSPGGPTVRLKWIKLRLKPRHNFYVALDGERKRFPARQWTTRKYDIDTTSHDYELLTWDGGNSVPVFIDSTWYAPKWTNGAGGCHTPFHHAGLKRHF